MVQMKPREQRWDAEAEFFDKRAQRAERMVTPTDPLTLGRYGAPSPRRWFNKEFRFRVMGNFTGKAILDVGCGDGANSVLLAKLGGRVTGIDISPKAIALAGQRAQIDGVSQAVRFLCAPIETAQLEPCSFDILWGDAILHHLIEELDALIPKLLTWVKPDGLVLFAEPVNFNQTLRRIRFMVPVHTDATPDERPLEPAEIALLRKDIPDLRLRMFTLFGRLDRFILPDYNYERSSAPRRFVAGSIAAIDYALLSLPWVKRLGATAVMYGHRV
jgi:2-polyprenyl-3-methyl-5-hydroxy-6-metoxy-1,4-benzoquinol methylase